MDNVGIETAVLKVLDNFPQPAVWTESVHDQSSGPVISSVNAGLPHFLADKSPVTQLQELSVKRGSTTHYELIECEGPLHQRVFTYRVTAGAFTATGKGMIDDLYSIQFGWLVF